MVYLITYDLKKPGQDYAAVYETIKGLGAWAHCLESVWLVDTSWSVNDIYNAIKSKVDGNDLFLIIKITNPHNGWLPQEMWDWINAHVR